MPVKDSAKTMFCKQEKCRAGNQQIKLVYWEVGQTDKEENGSMGLITFFTESWYHRMLWVERSLYDHLVPIPLLWEGMTPMRPGCPGPHPTWP